MFNLGDTIKDLRIKNGLTQKKLGSRIGVCEGTISKYEAGTSMPPFETLRAIAAVFHVSMDEIYGMEQSTLSTSGLTEAQAETVKALIDAYHQRNAQVVKQPTPRQFAILGQITAELTK